MEIINFNGHLRKKGGFKCFPEQCCPVLQMDSDMHKIPFPGDTEL
jgi:hypothetical protein